METVGREQRTTDSLSYTPDMGEGYGPHQDRVTVSEELHVGDRTSLCTYCKSTRRRHHSPGTLDLPSVVLGGCYVSGEVALRTPQTHSRELSPPRETGEVLTHDGNS